MAAQLIQDWTEAQVSLPPGRKHEVRYRVYRHEDKLFQEIRSLDDQPIHTLELPDGVALEKSSYEVLLRYVLSDVVAA